MTEHHASLQKLKFF